MTYVKDYTSRVRMLDKMSDGDTYWMYIDPGDRVWVYAHIRLDGYDTPETHTNKASAFEKQQGAIATQRAEAWIRDHLAAKNPIWLRTREDPEATMDRWLAEMWVELPDGTSQAFGDTLLPDHLATVWPTKWHEQYDPNRDKSAV